MYKNDQFRVQIQRNNGDDWLKNVWDFRLKLGFEVLLFFTVDAQVVECQISESLSPLTTTFSSTALCIR